MMHALRSNPVRLYAVATATLALVAHYVPDVPTPLVLALLAAVLGLGEVTRSKVTPNGSVALHVDEVPDLLSALYENRRPK